LVVDKFTSVTDDLEANPINLATASAPPSLLLHGEKDTTVYPFHTHSFTERLRQLGVPVEKHLYPDTDHVKLVGALSTTLRFLNSAQQDISNYLQKNGLDKPCK
jgi:acetyl esterase/lipase